MPGQQSGAVDEATKRADLIVQLLVELALAGNGTTLFSLRKSAREHRAHLTTALIKPKKESTPGCRSTPGNTYWSGESRVFDTAIFGDARGLHLIGILLELSLFLVATLVKDAPGLTISSERAAGCRSRKLQTARSI